MRLASMVWESNIVDQGNFSFVKDSTDKARIRYKQKETSPTYIFKTNTDISSHELKSYLPLHLTDGNNSFALEVEFKLADTDSVLECHNNGKIAATSLRV